MLKIKDSLKVSEIFYSIQAEGKTSGMPSYFIRLTGCNMLCGLRKEYLGMKPSWKCDSHEVWRSGKAMPFEEIIREMGGNDAVENLKNGVHLIMTGGEPMLQQEGMVEFFKYLKKLGIKRPFIEIETNGTIHPLEIRSFVSQWNLSPKLVNSGEKEKLRIHKTALLIYAGMNTQFKFVVSGYDDWREIEQDWLGLIQTKRSIWLMPAAETREELELIRPRIVEICKEEKVNYSDRLQITIWDKKTGV